MGVLEHAPRQLIPHFQKGAQLASTHGNVGGAIKRKGYAWWFRYWVSEVRDLYNNCEKFANLPGLEMGPIRDGL